MPTELLFFLLLIIPKIFFSVNQSNYFAKGSLIETMSIFFTCERSFYCFDRMIS